MDRDTYRELKESGGLVADAALQEEATEEVGEETEVEEAETEDTETDDGEESDVTEPDEPDDLPPLSEKEKTAFEKRMERERAKAEEKIRQELQEEYEQKYGKHKSVIELLGGDPDAIEKRIREGEMSRKAQQLAEQNGWDEEQTTWYIEQQKQAQELKELRVQSQINRLKDNPDYAGISQMEKEILSKIDKSAGALSVEEAYWALGGPKRAEQIRLEAQAREAEKRRQKPRTVITDTPTSNTGEKPLPPEIAREAERMGISAAEARRLMSKDTPKTIDEYRQRKAK